MRFHKGFTVIEFIIVLAIVGIFAAIMLPTYQVHNLRQQVKELLPTKAEEALSSQGKINYDSQSLGRTKIPSLFLSVSPQLYQGAPCEVYSGSLERERVIGSHVVVKYAPTSPPVFSECPAGVIALSKEDWILIYTAHFVISGEYDRQLEAEQSADKSKKEQDRLAVEREKQRGVEKKALDFLKKEGLLPNPNEK